MTAPESDTDMEFDPDEDDESEDEDGGGSQTGPWMMSLGAFLLGLLMIWDYFGSEVPSRGTYAVVAVWLMLGALVAIAEVVYQ